MNKYGFIALNIAHINKLEGVIELFNYKKKCFKYINKYEIKEVI